MDEDTDSTNWVLVDEVDCAEEAISLNPSVTSVPATPDSDQESDGSISIIGDHPTDYSEEETEPLKTNDHVTTKNMPIITIDAEFETEFNEKEALEQNIASLETSQVEDSIKEVSSSHQKSDDDESFTSESSSKQWTFAGGKSKLELDTPKQPFFLDSSQESILEVAKETDVDKASTASLPQCHAVAKKEDSPVTNISPKDPARERDTYINRISIGFIISMLILTSSHLIRQYLDHTEDGLPSSSPTTSFLESIADNEKARPIVNFCVNRQKAKGHEYSEHAVEKCVIKRLRKKNREDAVKKTEIYLQMKERILELREKELAEKEREILKKWRKRAYIAEDVQEEVVEEKRKYDKKHKDKENKVSNEFERRLKRNSENKEGKSHERQDSLSGKEQKTWNSDDIKGKIKIFRKKGTWTFEKAKEPSLWNHKIHSKDDLSDKKIKKANKDKEETLKEIRNQVKGFQKEKTKRIFRDLRGDKKEDQNEEWYIKYNPVKNTIELINITTLSEQDSILIKNGNKTINGQWYFSLYGSGRSNIRNKEKAAEWYFRRGNFREQKRDKAKWYFDYMSARDNTRYFY